MAPLKFPDSGEMAPVKGPDPFYFIDMNVVTLVTGSGTTNAQCPSQLSEWQQIGRAFHKHRHRQELW